MHVFAARSVAPVAGVQAIVVVPAWVVVAPDGVPSVSVIDAPLWTIVDGVPVAPKSRCAVR